MLQSLHKPQRLPENPTANVQVARRSGINAEQNKQRPSETAAFSRERRLPENLMAKFQVARSKSRSG
ncbi:hypothetical protein NEIFL0001_2199 [Neisseria flavescens SK114]|nr:hypothetical protein NEIFL0001_2199 [Neisseria flavescens SK114]